MLKSVSSLDNIPTTVRFPLEVSYQAYATKFLSVEWAAVLETYGNLDASDGRYRAQRLSDCRQIAWFCRNDMTGQVRVSANHCKLRWCPVCGAAKKTLIAHEIRKWLPTTQYPKLLSLTLKHSPESLTDQVNHLYSSFRKLRKTSLMTKNISGGVWFFQITYNEETETWHPHLHCLITGKYVSQGKLSRLWHQITRDSKIIDIRLVTDHLSAAHEVARYCARPSPIKDLPRAQRVELFTTMHGRRICGTWGGARTLNLSSPKTSEPGKWIRLARWNTIRSHLETELDAQQIVQAWRDKTFLPLGIDYMETEDFIDKSFPFLEPEPPPPLLWDNPL